MNYLVSPRRSLAVAVLTLGTLLVVSSLVPSAAASPRRTAATKNSTTALRPGTILDHRFVKDFALSDGSLRLSPFVGTAPILTPREETILMATQNFGGTFEGIGYADVTVKGSSTTMLSAPALTTLKNTPSLVGLAKSDDVYSCPLMRAGEGTSFIPVSQGWEAVIFPLNVKKSDVVFAASSNVCGHLNPNTVGAAYETLSVDWHLETHRSTGTVIVASVPGCGRIIMSGGGGNEFTHRFEYQVEAVILDRPLSTVCSRATNVDEGPNYASASTIHGFVGPVLTTGPHAGDVMTSSGPKAQPLF